MADYLDYDVADWEYLGFKSEEDYKNYMHNEVLNNKGG